MVVMRDHWDRICFVTFVVKHDDIVYVEEILEVRMNSLQSLGDTI